MSLQDLGVSDLLEKLDSGRKDMIGMAGVTAPDFLPTYLSET